MINDVQGNIESKLKSDFDKKNDKLKWYVVHTYSGFENKAKKALEERIKQHGFEGKFNEILIPSESVERIFNGKRIIQVKKCFPSYIFVEMEFNEETAHLVRHTSKITGFVGNAKNPSSLTSKEAKKMRFAAMEAPRVLKEILYCIGDLVMVTEGPFTNFNGNIEEIKPDKKKVRLMVSIFGRLTPVELDYSQIKKI